MKVSIGKGIKLDVMKLVESRLLLQGSSGSGKSMTARTIIEETFGIVPIIIIDIEGEFSTLREKYDFILAGKGGDIPVDVRTAQLLARKVLELNASIIIDISELKPHERQRWVKLFVEALLDAPKELWGPRVLFVDEAHIFCPEQGKSETAETIIDLCSRGRKRGLGTILATQRLSKLHKDAAAECTNKIIGLANIDIDRERSAKELGFTHREDILSLRDLEPGEFYCVGPALCRSVTKTMINLAKTTHPKIGRRAIKAPVATKKVLHLLEKMKDLPQEAEQELKTQSDMRVEIGRLKQELRNSKGTLVAPKVVEKLIPDTKGTEEIRKKYEDILHTMRTGIMRALDASRTPLKPWRQPLSSSPIRPMPKPVAMKTSATEAFVQPNLATDPALGRCELAILKFLAMRPGKNFNRIQIGVMTGYSPTSGGLKNSISKLRAMSLIVQSGPNYSIKDTEQARALLGSAYSTPDKDSLVKWLDNLGPCPKAVYDIILKDPDRVITREDIAAQTIYQATSGGLKNAISQLCTLGLVMRDSGGIRLNDEIKDL